MTTSRNTSIGMDDQLRVDDLLYGNGPYPRADFGRRFAAYLIDSIVFIFLFVPFLFIANLTNVDQGDIPTSSILGMFFTLLIPFAYFLLKDGMFNGRSLGKMALGLMTIDIVAHRPCSLGKSFLRNLLGGVLAFVGPGGVVDMVMMLTDAEGRRVGDRACKTQVIAADVYRVS